MFPLNITDLIIYSLVSDEAHMYTPIFPDGLLESYLSVQETSWFFCAQESSVSSDALFFASLPSLYDSKCSIALCFLLSIYLEKMWKY